MKCIYDSLKFSFPAKNAQDRSVAVAGDPTICDEAPVAEKPAYAVGKPPTIRRHPNTVGATTGRKKAQAPKPPESMKSSVENSIPSHPEAAEPPISQILEDDRRDEGKKQVRPFRSSVFLHSLSIPIG